MTSENMLIAIGGVLAVLLQVLLAPHIALFSAVPNIAAAYAMAIAVVRPQLYGPILPFVLGLFFDLAGGGPVGAMAFSLTALSSLVAWVLARAGNDSRFVEIAALGFGLLLVELVFGVFLLLFGYNAGFFDAIAYRVAPCAVYDFAIGIALYLLAARFLRAGGTTQSPIGITQLR